MNKNTNSNINNIEAIYVPRISIKLINEPAEKVTATFSFLKKTKNRLKHYYELTNAKTYDELIQKMMDVFDVHVRNELKTGGKRGS